MKVAIIPIKKEYSLTLLIRLYNKYFLKGVEQVLSF